MWFDLGTPRIILLRSPALRSEQADLLYYTLKINKGNSFSITYGAGVVIPLESGLPTLRIDQFNVEENNRLLLDSLDVAEERREVATIKMAYYQQKLK